MSAFSIQVPENLILLYLRKQDKKGDKMHNVFSTICTQIGSAFPDTKIYFTGIEESFTEPCILVGFIKYEAFASNRCMFTEKMSFKITQCFYANYIDHVEGQNQIGKFVMLKELFQNNGLTLNDGTKVVIQAIEAGMNKQNLFLIIHLERTLIREESSDYEIMKTLEYKQQIAKGGI